MPNGDSNVLFCSISIASVGTCPPLAMNFKICFFDSFVSRPEGWGVLCQEEGASPQRLSGMAKTAPHSSSAVGLVVR